MEMEFLKASRQHLRVGDVFAFGFAPNIFHFGRVVATEVNAGGFPGACLLYLYRGSSTSRTEPVSMTIADLACPPMMTNELAWTHGYFQTVANLPFGAANELLTQHAFRQDTFSERFQTRYVDEFGKPVERPGLHIGTSGLHSYHAVSDAVYKALYDRQRFEYFWTRTHRSGLPAQAIRSPSELENSDSLNIACTQTELSPSSQRKLVDAWCQCLPTLEGVKYLWFSSRASQKLFDAACSIPGLEGLHIKWSGVESLESIREAPTLRHLHLGSSARVQSIDPIAEMSELRSLGLINTKRVADLTPLASLTRLEELMIGGDGSTQCVANLKPLGHLVNLKYLCIDNLRSSDKSLVPLFALRNLETFHHSQEWSQGEIAELRRNNPKLYG